VKRKVKLEQYYTTKDLVDQCLSFIEKHFNFDDFDVVLEPSAGDGVFLKESFADKTIAFDLDPKNPNVTKQDFFQWCPPSDKKIITIGNPPFGQRGSLAVKFTNKAMEFSDVVAFILPRSFRKDTFYNRLGENFHLVDQFDCDSFRNEKGELLTIKCVFQIWEKKNYPRIKSNRKNTHDDFQMKHAHLSRVSEKELENLRNEYDFCIAQVGSNFKPRNPKDINSGSYWFIKSINPNVKHVFNNLDFSFLDNMNLSFKSLSKKDIIQAYENFTSK
jgi:hypothetical protein